MLREHRLRLNAGLVLAAGAAGCDWITGGDDPREARVAVSATTAAAPVPVVTSTSFGVLPGGEVALAEADTQRVSLPLDRRYPLDGSGRFYVEVGPAAEGDTLLVEMRVWIDDTRWFDERRVLGADEPGVIRFVYRFSRPRL